MTLTQNGKAKYWTDSYSIFDVDAEFENLHLASELLRLSALFEGDTVNLGFDNIYELSHGIRLEPAFNDGRAFGVTAYACFMVNGIEVFTVEDSFDAKKLSAEGKDLEWEIKTRFEKVFISVRNQARNAILEHVNQVDNVEFKCF